MISNKKIHYELPLELLIGSRQENIFNWCKTNTLADEVELIRTEKSINEVLKEGTVDRKKIFENMFEKKITTVKEAKEIAKKLKEKTLYQGMADIVLAWEKNYIKTRTEFINKILSYDEDSLRAKIEFIIRNKHKKNDPSLRMLAGMSNDQISAMVDDIANKIDEEEKKDILKTQEDENE